MTSVKRNLFTTPSRVKRQKTTGAMTRKSTTMQIPKSLLPETKQYILGFEITQSTVNSTWSSIPTDMFQGDDASQFIGSKFRIQRIRVHYDYTGLAMDRGFRMMLVIPKDPSLTAPVPIGSEFDEVDTDQYTVLHDQLMSNDSSLRAGTFDWTGPLNVEMNKSGVTPLRNNVFLYIYSTGAGGLVQFRTKYAVWFTDN